MAGSQSPRRVSQEPLREPPQTPPRTSHPTSTPTPPSLGHKLKTPPRHTQLPLPLPVADTHVPISLSSVFPLHLPLSLPLNLPTETTTLESHDLFGDPLYYNAETSSLESIDCMSLGHGLDLDMAADLGTTMNTSMSMDLDLDLGLDLGLDPDLNFATDVDLGQVMHLSGSPSLHSRFHSGPSALMAASTTTAAMPTAVCDNSNSHANANISQQQPPCRHRSASPPTVLFNKPSMPPDSASPYGNPEDYAMNMKKTANNIVDAYMAPSPLPPVTTASSFPGLFPLHLPREPSPATIFVRNNSPPVIRSHGHQSRDSHTTDIDSIANIAVLDSILPSVEAHDGFGPGYISRANSRDYSHGRRCSGGSSSSLDSMVGEEEDRYFARNTKTRPQPLLSSAPITPIVHAHPHPHTSNVNGPPPADPSDWRARLRYCEQAVHKASLDASLVRLLQFPEGLDAHELEARRAANLRFDRVREQRLKDRNNEAAKRSRQRKVRRIEDAEQRIEALKQDRAYLSSRVAFLEKQLAAATIGVQTGQTSQNGQNGQGVHKAYRVRGGASSRCTKPQERRGSLGRGQTHGQTHGHRGRGSGSGRTMRSRGDGSSNNTGFPDDDDDDDNEEASVNGNDVDSPNGGTITVGIMA
ncbi:hypothetical protein SCUCBS95973_005723 [Sporothrix curviconia]|uniref:BZIP domain-containing protein n=1 Tax=Sporothrix curviconia TaxID=1260050 RepID=A0ABP0C030_9PEZI